MQRAAEAWTVTSPCDRRVPRPAPPAVQQVRQYSAALAAAFTDAGAAASLKSSTTALSNIADTIETTIKNHVKPPNTVRRCP